MPQLDGLRALAILSVMGPHLMPSVWGRLPGGEIGVRIFFVLSGFLITGILLRVREASKSSGQSIAMSLRQFYIRRALRIFPVYYVGLAAAIAGGLLIEANSWPWFVTYTSNWYTVIFDRHLGFVNHFWSLCVEEQFYLAWPLVVLCVPANRLLPVSMMMMAGSIAFRLAATLVHARYHTIYENTFSSLDALAIGSILAQTLPQTRHLTPDGADRRLHQSLLRIGWFVALPVVAIASVLHLVRIDSWISEMFVVPVATAFAGFALVERAARGGRWVLARLLDNVLMRFIGQISYGLYVYHLLVYGLLVAMMNALGHQWTDLGLVRTPLVVGLSFVVAIISWYGMEKPLNRYKSRFPYVLKAGDRKQQSKEPAAN